VNDFRFPVRAEVDGVEAFLKDCCAATGVDLIDQVWEHLLQVPGKRLRPTLLLLSAKAHGRPQPHGVVAHAIMAGAAVEMIHTATLIHDDVVDKATFRRGQAAVNHRWHDGVALMMGDFLYSKAFQLFTAAGLRREMAVLADATNRMSIAEMMQFEHHGRLDLTEDEYLHLIQEKTAALIEASCKLGAMLAGAADGAAIARYGHYVGLAFQITDDLLDYLGDEWVVGKPVGSDLREGKVTLPLIAALRNAAESARDTMIRDIRSGTLFGGQWPRMVDFVQANGGVAYAMQRARGFARQAQEALQQLPASAARDALDEAVEFMVSRCN
jgi:octaprenyl-diphosphate synthase